VQTGTLIALAVIGILLGMWLVYALRALVLLILIAMVISVGIDPLVERMHRVQLRNWHLPRGLAAVLILLAAILVMLGILTFFTVTAVTEATSFYHYIQTVFFGDPQVSQALLDQSPFMQWVKTYLDTHPEQIAWVTSQSGQLTGYLWTTTRAVFGVLGGLFSLVLALILTLFFTIYKPDILYTLLLFVPARHHPRLREIGSMAAERMGGWLRGQIILSIIIAVVTALAMWLLRVPYAMMIALIAGLGEMIPMLGPAIGFVPALLIVLATGAAPWQLIAVLVFFPVLAQVENYVLAPKVMEQHVELSPITTILALLAGGTLGGIVGALLAVPLAAGLRIVLLEAVFPAIQGTGRAEIEAHRPGGLPPPASPPDRAPASLPDRAPAETPNPAPAAATPPAPGTKRRKGSRASV